MMPFPFLQFDEAKHEYRLGGRPVLGTTAILKGAIGNLYTDVPLERNEFSLIFGKATHHACRLLDEELLDWASVDERLVSRIRAWEKWKADYRAQIWGVEVPLGSVRHQFAGTIDRFVSIHGNDDDHLILDIKTGPLKPTVALQLAAYGILYDENHKRKHRGRFAVELKADGTYRCQPYTDKRDYRIFQACLTVAQFKMAHGL